MPPATTRIRAPIASRLLFVPDQPEIQKMISVAAAVVQQQRNVSVVGDHNIHESVVVEVRERDAPSDVGSLKSVARRLAHFHELAIVLVVKQGIELLVVNPRRGLLDFGINVAVGDKDIQPAVVVVIEKAASKTQYPREWRG